MSNKEIYDTNEAAKKFKPQLKELIIATSADSDVNTQEYTREINKKNKENNIFSISVIGWQEICELLNKHKKFFNLLEYGKCNNPSIELYINGFVTSNVILKPKYLRKTIKTTYISSQISNKNYLMSPFEYNADYFKFMKPLVTETRRRDYLKSLHKNRRNIKSTTGNKEIVDMFLTAIRHSMPTTSSIDEFTTKNFFSYPITNKNSESIIIDNILSE